MVCTSRPSLNNEGVVKLSRSAIEQGGEQRHQIRPRVKASNGAIEQRHQLRPRVKASISTVKQRHEVNTKVITEVKAEAETATLRTRAANGFNGKGREPG